MPDPHTGIVLTIKEIITITTGIVISTIAGWRLFINSKLKQLESIGNRVDVLEKEHVSRHYFDKKADEISGKLDHQGERIDDIYKYLSKRD